MKFKYLDCSPDLPPSHKTFRPVVELKVRFGKKAVDLLALIDSGADVCLFPSEIGRALGIPIEQGKRSAVSGIGRQTYSMYLHQVVITFARWQMKIPIYFSSAVRTPILGQKGFFEFFEVKLCYARGYFEIQPFSSRKRLHLKSRR